MRLRADFLETYTERTVNATIVRLRRSRGARELLA